MKKYLYITIVSLAITPYLAYSALQAVNPMDPDIVNIKQPSLFAGKWEKSGFSTDFTEYINQAKIERNLDGTLEVVSMRNFFKTQNADDSDKNLIYKSQVSRETIDCFNQTISVSKLYLLSDKFAAGSLVDDPIETDSTPIKVMERTVGLSKIKMVCKIANQGTDSDYIKSNFMRNI